MNDNSRLTGYVLNGKRAKLLGPKAAKESWAPVVALLAVMLLVLSSGCASVSVQGDSAPCPQDPTTGCPAAVSVRPSVL